MTTITVWADIRCPWCWMGHRRLEAALERSGREFTVVRRSFLLEPAGPDAPDRTVLCGPVGAALMVVGLIPVAAAAGGFVLMGVGMGMAIPQISSTVLTLSPEEEQGHNSSALQVSESVLTSSLMAATGAVLAVAFLGGYPTVYALTGAVGVVALAVTPTLRPVREAADGDG